MASGNVTIALTSCTSSSGRAPASCTPVAVPCSPGAPFPA